MKRPQSRQGFTLIEIVLAISIGSILMVAASFYIFSLTQLYLNTENDPRLEEHMYSVGKTLEYMVSSAIDQTPKTNDPAKKPFEKFTKKTKQKTETTRIVWKNPEELSFADTPLLSLKIPTNGLPLFVWEKGGPLPVITCYIYFRPKEGLFILWQSTAQKEEEEIQRTLVSSLIKKLTFDYYDAENNSWEHSEEPLETGEGELRLPQVLTLTFQYHGREEKSRISLPFTSSDNALVY